MPKIAESVKSLSVNIDHIATLREARRESFPDPVHAAVLAELGGADGITIHLRHDRRHIRERDAELLKAVLKTELNMELAATPDMAKIARTVKPAQVSLVPETPEEVTTQGGLDLVRGFARIAPIAKSLKKGGIRLSAFIEADTRQIEAAARLGCDLIELNTDRYCRTPGADPRFPSPELVKLREAAKAAAELGLRVHAGHGIDYRNIVPLLEIPELDGFSIGFSIVARAVFTGLAAATREMKRTIAQPTAGSR